MDTLVSSHSIAELPRHLRAEAANLVFRQQS